MEIGVDYEREVITINGYDISFGVLEHLTTDPAPGPWARITRREDKAIYIQRATTDTLLEQWLMDGKGK